MEVQCTSVEKRHCKEDEYSIILANLYANLLENLASSFYILLSSKGTLVISGILLEQATQIKRVFKSYGWFLKHEKSLEDWVVLVLKKMEYNA